MDREYPKRNTTSLLSITINYLVNNLSKFNGDIELLSELPEHIRTRMLHKFTTTPYFWRNVDFKKVFTLLTHKNSDHINLTSCTVDDDMLNIIKNCHNLREVYLTRVGKHNITTQGLLDLIPNLKQVYLLRISRCSAVTDDVIECIAEHCKILGGLDVGGCKEITDKSLKVLAKMTNLKWLNFSNTQVTDEGIELLVTGPSGPKLKELRIADCPNITECILRSVASNCPEMEVIEFHNCSKVQDQTCFAFQEGSLKKLKQLNWTIQW